VVVRRQKVKQQKLNKVLSSPYVATHNSTCGCDRTNFRARSQHDLTCITTIKCCRNEKEQVLYTCRHVRMRNCSKCGCWCCANCTNPHRNGLLLPRFQALRSSINSERCGTSIQKYSKIAASMKPRSVRVPTDTRLSTLASQCSLFLHIRPQHTWLAVY